MFAQEPDLKFVGAQHLANNQIIGAVIAQGGSPARERSGSTNDDLVSIEQARKLYGHFFATAGRPLNLRRLGYIRGHGDANAAEELNAFSDGVNQFILLVVMFVIKQMELDRKSTRLNSSHGYISYAVFCLKKKKYNDNTNQIDEKIVSTHEAITYITC